jgi:hypothetical protein
MMQSPIDDRVWKYLFHTVTVTATAAMFWSLYRERRDGRSKLSNALTMCRDSDEKKSLAGIQSISAILDDEVRNKKGVSILTARSKLGYILAKVKYVKDSENDTCVSALRLIRRVCDDADGRHALFKAKGYRVILSCLSEAHRQGNVRVMEEAAKALEEVTAIDYANIVLPADIPRGCEGAAELASFPATPKMLRTLDPSCRVSFLSAVAGALCNISVLQKGARALQPGTDGKLGAYYFLQLLSHTNEAIVEKAMRATRYLSALGESQHALICEDATVQTLVSVLNASTSIQQNCMRLVHNMIKSSHSEKFFSKFAEDGFPALFRVWTKSSEKTSRDMAEALVHLLEKSPMTGPRIQKLLDLYRPDIQERRAKDEEVKKKQMEQMRQQQMMRQAMMQQMMGGMGGDMGDMMGDD